ncbi:hypothetical protein IV203_020019 [Nitzschia inconspicua]|uniref:Uncharacterized protein n=1 Tax=Nitzschia inconspicua TaxID=303405 RepID=A0A9K3LZU3_9STRA|nr:hypothetical protein IV203_020019 [Nitzschia inconspicua]
MNPIPFADDPVRGKPISLATGDVEGLDPGQWLSTSLVDYVLQTSLAGKLPDHVLIGSSNCSTYFHKYNSKLRNEDDAHCVQQKLIDQKFKNQPSSQIGEAIKIKCMIGCNATPRVGTGSFPQLATIRIFLLSTSLSRIVNQTFSKG